MKLAAIACFIAFFFPNFFLVLAKILPLVNSEIFLEIVFFELPLLNGLIFLSFLTYTPPNISLSEINKTETMFKLKLKPIKVYSIR